MSRVQLRRTVIASLAACALAGSARHGSGDDSKENTSENRFGFTNLDPAMLNELRAAYPFRSLAGRLAYEAPYRNGVRPPLGTKSDAALEASDRSAQWGGILSHRGASLGLLHAQNVDAFIKSPGFGLTRMGTPGPSYLESPQSEPIPFADVAPSSAEEARLPPTSTLVSFADVRNPAKNPWLLPIVEDLDDLNEDARGVFASSNRFGYVKSIDQVAGFEAHRFDRLPMLPVDEARAKPSPQRHRYLHHHADERWKLARLELVSLLKHDAPRVYLSEHLPRMEDLSSAKTRALDDFETQALEALRQGEDLRTSATPNRIAMVGALRATAHCSQCHQVPHGTLLGAFTYDLRREPPIRVAAPGGALQQ